MRILLDECLPARLRQGLADHQVMTVPRAGWAGIKNGRLLRLISDAASYDVFVTMDQNLPHQQQCADLSFAIVVLRARSNRFEDIHPLMPEFLRRSGEFQPGRVYVIPESG
jgi:hypothetical protein